MRYLLSGIRIQSDLYLPELQPADPGTPDCTLLLSPDGPIGGDWSIVRHYPDDADRPWLSIARDSSRYLLQFHDLADFVVSDVDGVASVGCRARHGTPELTVRHLFINQVVPLLLSRRGELVLHAGAVVSNGEGLGILGPSGCGKSSLVLALCQHGCGLLGDDCLRLETRDGVVVGYPSHPGVRLWEDSAAQLHGGAPTGPVAHYTIKRRLDSSAFVDEPAPIRRLFALAPREEMERADEVTLRPLRGQAAFDALNRTLYRIDGTDPSRLRREFEQVGRVLASAEVISLTYPWDLGRLPDVCRQVLR